MGGFGVKYSAVICYEFGGGERIVFAGLFNVQWFLCI